ncbi:hypothetical protein L0244_28450 [bacterium]|nr:hypothetical protein [bacterium]
MLNIAIENIAEEKKFILEGKITKDWCNFLLNNWENERKDLGNRTCIVDLNKVTVIDECGMGVLAEMNRTSIKFRASGMLLLFLLTSMIRKAA